MRRRRTRAAGQTLVEFAIAVTVFLMLVIGTVDLGRAVYQFNGVSEAAREIARVTSVHPGSTLGTSDETLAVVSSQRAIIPSLVILSYTCVDLAGAPVTGNCIAGDWVRVSATARFTPVMPLLLFLGSIDLSSSSSARLE